MRKYLLGSIYSKDGGFGKIISLGLLLSGLASTLMGLEVLTTVTSSVTATQTTTVLVGTTVVQTITRVSTVQGVAETVQVTAVSLSTTTVLTGVTSTAVVTSTTGTVTITVTGTQPITTVSAFTSTAPVVTFTETINRASTDPRFGGPRETVSITQLVYFTKTLSGDAASLISDAQDLSVLLLNRSQFV